MAAEITEPNAPFDVNPSDPFRGMDFSPIPVWAYSVPLNLIEKTILGYIDFRCSIRGQVTIYNQTLRQVAYCSRSMICKSLKTLKDGGYVIIKPTMNGGGANLFSLGPESLELKEKMTKLREGSSIPIHKVDTPIHKVDTPIHEVDTPHPRGGYPPSTEKTPPIHVVDTYKNYKNIKKNKGEEQNPPSYRFTHSFLTEKYKELLLLPSWEGLSSSCIRSNYGWLKQKEREDPYYSLAAMEYSLNHNYRGIFNERDYSKRAAELRHELAGAIAQSQPVEPTKSDNEVFKELQPYFPEELKEAIYDSYQGENRSLCFRLKDGEVLVFCPPEIQLWLESIPETIRPILARWAGPNYKGCRYLNIKE